MCYYVIICYDMLTKFILNFSILLTLFQKHTSPQMLVHMLHISLVCCSERMQQLHTCTLEGALLKNEDITPVPYQSRVLAAFSVSRLT